jgi:putative phage-type endonuclease
MIEATPENIRMWRLTPQGTASWLKAREGRITASRLADVMAVLKKKEGESAARRNYRTELIAERIAGRAEDHYLSREMDEGTANEPFARTAYEIAENVEVDQVGFIVHPWMTFSGASPDGLIGTEGGLEIKAPKITTHIGYIQAGVIPPEYEAQMLWNMACCDRSWWDFLSYCPTMPEGSKCFLRRLERDNERIAAMENEVQRFEGEIQAALDALGWKPQMEKAKVEPAFDEALISEEDITDWYTSHGMVR